MPRPLEKPKFRVSGAWMTGSSEDIRRPTSATVGREDPPRWSWQRLQVLMVFTFDDKGQRMYTDYWCDICSIPMYEIKPCDCCQQPIRLRFRIQELPKDVVEHHAGT